MTKEQFLTFKEDFKKTVTVAKLENKYRKEYYNCGFKTLEEYDKACKERREQVREIINTVSVIRERKLWDSSEQVYKQYNSLLYYATEDSVHKAYYIAKHQLNKEDAIKYLSVEFKKQHLYEGLTDAKIKEYAEYVYLHRITNILSLYDKAVRDN